MDGTGKRSRSRAAGWETLPREGSGKLAPGSAQPGELLETGGARLQPPRSQRSDGFGVFLARSLGDVSGVPGAPRR